MSVYLDASVLVSIFALDPLTQKAKQRLAAVQDDLVVSNFAAAEFASAIGGRVRTKVLSAADGKHAFTAFDMWRVRHAVSIEAQSIDIALCDAFLRRLTLTLRTPDALNLAVAQRLGAAVLTFDAKMTTAAKKLGILLA